MENPENTEGAIKNGKFRETAKKKAETKQKHNTIK